MTLFAHNLPNIKSKIRLIHAIPTAPNVDIYANGELIGKNLAFSNITPYVDLTPGSYEIQIYLSGTSDNTLFSKLLNLSPSSILTISVIISGSNIDLFVLEDTNASNNDNNTLLRFINLSPNSSLLTLSLNNDIILFDDVEYLETTNYTTLSSGIYDLVITSSYLQDLRKYISNLKLNNEKFYTIYIIGLLNSSPKLGYIITEDFKS